MKKTIAVRNLIISLIISSSLLYFLWKTPSPKIILAPFLICSLSLAGQSMAQLLNKEKWAAAFRKLFALSFFLFWFGFLVVAAFLCIRDKHYGMLLFTLPFWFVGIYFARNKLLGKRSSKADSPFTFPVVISAVLVTAAFAAGIFLLVLGIRRGEPGLLLAGGFFLFGALTFVLAALTIRGTFAKCKIDVLGMYMGCFLSATGIITIIWKGKDLGFVLLIPALMTVAGVLQIIKCLKNKK